MCEICRKYRCPDGCPNNYTPTRRPKREREIGRRWRFDLVSRWGEDRGYDRLKSSGRNKNNNEIISKDINEQRGNI